MVRSPAGDQCCQSDAGGLGLQRVGWSLIVRDRKAIGLQSRYADG